MSRSDRNIRLSVYLNDKTGGKTLRELRKETRKLRNEIADLPRGTEEYIKKSRRLRQVSVEINKINKDLRQQKSLWSRTADGFGKYFTMITAGAAAFAGLALGAKNIIQRNAELSDSYADVMKTTGLSLKGVKALSKEFKDFDTRSTRKELLDLARIAGKLGINGKQNILGFVKAADQINVALSEDLGGNAEEAIRQVGKLTQTFRLVEKNGISLEDGMIKTGSAINSLGAASTANEAYLVEFAKRLGGIAPVAGISLQNVLGLGAALDSLGQTSEVSSTVIQKILPNMFKDTAEYAKVAKMNVGEFTTLLNTDANEAVLKLLEGLKGNNEGFSTMAKKMDQLGLDGARSVGVLAVLANNIDVVREQQALANEEFEKGTSLTEEFNIKNENLAAKLAKVGRKIRAAFINSNITGVLTRVVDKVEEWVNKPLSEKLEDERDKVNRLVIELRDVNIESDRRKVLLDELKTIAPEVVEGIDSEKVAFEQLNEQLETYNSRMLESILIQSKSEDLEKQGEKVQRFKELTIKAKAELRDVLFEFVDGEKFKKANDKADTILQDTNLTLQQRATELRNLAVSEGLWSSYKIQNAMDSYDAFNKNHQLEIQGYESLQVEIEETKKKYQELFDVKFNEDPSQPGGGTEPNEGDEKFVTPELSEKDKAARDKKLKEERAFYFKINELRAKVDLDGIEEKMRLETLRYQKELEAAGKNNELKRLLKKDHLQKMEELEKLHYKETQKIAQEWSDEDFYIIQYGEKAWVDYLNNRKDATEDFYSFQTRIAEEAIDAAVQASKEWLDEDMIIMQVGEAAYKQYILNRKSEDESYFEWLKRKREEDVQDDKDRNQERASYYLETYNNLKGVANAANEYYLIQQQNRADKLDKEKEKELATLEAMFKARRIDEEAYSEMRLEINERFDDQAKEQAKEDAEYAKKIQIFQIILKTVETVAAIGLKAAQLAADPLTLPYVPITLAQIPFALATGAIGIASVSSKHAGLFTGGYSGDGDPTEEAGRLPNGQVYHKKEYVIPSFIRDNPVVAQMEPIIENIRRQKLGGYYDGGNVTDIPQGQPIDNTSVLLLEEIKGLRSDIQNFKYVKAIIDQDNVLELKEAFSDIDDIESASKA